MPLYVHSLTFTPPRRFDEQPWNRVRVEQSADNTTFTALETIALTSGDVDPSVLDPAPASPAERKITTDQATLATAYFRVVWLDSDNAESPASGSVLSPSQADEVRTRLELLILADEDPVLSEAQILAVLTYARRPDPDDLDYEDANWTPTWDLDAAAAEGWRRKAGLAASRFNFAEDGQRFDRAQVYAHCVAQAEYYGNRSMGVIPTDTA